MTAPDKLRALVAAGLSTPEIAARLGVTERTVNRARSAAGCSSPPGRPATGERPRLPSPRVDPEVIEAIEAEAARREVEPADVVETIVTRWARRR